jgi:transmembrane sensor
VGGHEVVSLPDGSTIDLNTNTELRVRVSSASRNVELVRGETMIHVRHDSQRPFAVSVGEIVIHEVGTKFDVRRRDDASMEVMIESGKLILFNRRRQIATLSEGDVALVSPQGVRVDRPGEEVIKRKLSWQHGILRFEGQSLHEVVAEFNRYNRKQMVIDDPRLAEIRLGGEFPPSDPESFVSALRHVYGVQYTSIPSPDGGVIRLKSSSAKAPTG